jgi:hypothetical protein
LRYDFQQGQRAHADLRPGLPVIRRQVDSDLAEPGLPREKVLARRWYQGQGPWVSSIRHPQTPGVNEKALPRRSLCLKRLSYFNFEVERKKKILHVATSDEPDAQREVLAVPKTFYFRLIFVRSLG